MKVPERRPDGLGHGKMSPHNGVHAIAAKGKNIDHDLGHIEEWASSEYEDDGKLKAPFPAFGGKSKMAGAVWQRFGNVTTYVEPFCFSAAVLWGRPAPFKGREILNDANGYVSNFWRAMQADPESVAAACDFPVVEHDLHARHVWLTNEGANIIARCYDDPEFYDARVAGWWAWGLSCWIGSGWCDVPMTHGEKVPDIGSAVHNRNKGTHVIAARVSQQSPGLDHLRGIHGTAQKVSEKRTAISYKLGPGTGCVCAIGLQSFDSLLAAFSRLQSRLRHVKVCAGDWQRVVTDGVIGNGAGDTAIFLDPPYTAKAGRTAKIYAVESLTVGNAVAAWAFARPHLKIALCGYEGEYEVPGDWETLEWKAQGGYANQGDGQGKLNKAKERIWFSPACREAGQGKLL